MTDISIVRGDSKRFQVTFQDQNGDPVDITGGVVRFSVKRRSSIPNAEATIFKASYDEDEISLTDPVNGICLISILAEDTEGDAPGDYCYDVELTRQEVSLTTAGSIAVTNGSGIMVGTGLDLSNVKVGDILVPSGTFTPNQKPVVVVAVGGDGSANDPGPGNLLTDYTGWTDEAGISVDIQRGNRKTATNLLGTFSMVEDVTL